MKMSLFSVRRMRLELTRHCCHYPLKVACIPISPPAQYFLDHLCPEQDSNLHTSRHTHLKRTRLPIPPPGLKKCRTLVLHTGAMNETRTRDPDLGKVVLYQLSYHRKCVRTLLLPNGLTRCRASRPKAAAKVLLFFDTAKFFDQKNTKKCIFYLYPPLFALLSANRTT